MAEKTIQQDQTTTLPNSTVATEALISVPAEFVPLKAKKRKFPKTGPLVVIALFILLTVVVGAVTADVVAPLKRQGLTFKDKLKPPFWDQWSTPDPNATPKPRFDPNFPLGTDSAGQNILTYLIHGARTSLIIGVAVATLAGLIGVLLGLLAGFKGKIIDTIIMRVVDIQIAFPFIVLAIVIGAIFKPNMFSLIVILTIAGWPFFARVTRGEVIAVRARDYILAATAVGMADRRIALRHILPNITSSIIVYWTFLVGIIILAEAGISFLGLGLPPPAISWGGMITEGRIYLDSAWWVPFWPSLVLTLVVVSINTVGDWLRDVLDPTTTRR